MESLSSKQRRVALPYPQQQRLGEAADAAEQQRASRRKRPRRQLQPQQHRAAADVEDTAASCRQCVQGPEQVVDAVCEYDVCLYVRWHSPEGGTKVKRLPLDPIASVDDLRGLFRRLIQGAFSGSPLPDYLTCPDFYKFSPAEDCICLPGDVARTHFRLVVTLGGWEYGVVDRELGVAPDPARNLLVTVAEFESDVFELDGQECVMNLISYPTICVRRDFLDAAVRELQRSRAAGGGSGDEDTQGGAPSPAPAPGPGPRCSPALGPPMPASSTSA